MTYFRIFCCGIWHLCSSTGQRSVYLSIQDIHSNFASPYKRNSCIKSRFEAIAVRYHNIFQMLCVMTSAWICHWLIRALQFIHLVLWSGIGQYEIYHDYGIINLSLPSASFWCSLVLLHMVSVAFKTTRMACRSINFYSGSINVYIGFIIIFVPKPGKVWCIIVAHKIRWSHTFPVFCVSWMMCPRAFPVLLRRNQCHRQVQEGLSSHCWYKQAFLVWINWSSKLIAMFKVDMLPRVGYTFSTIAGIHHDCRNNNI